MPTKPKVTNVSKKYTSVGILQKIFQANADGMFENAPSVEATTESIRAAGQYIFAYTPRRNTFVRELMNRIGMVRLYYMLFTNPWAWAKQGKMEMGETVEQIWIDLAKAFPFNSTKSEERFLKQEKPQVHTAFHSLNYRTVYKVSISDAELKQAFLSVDGLVNFVETVIGSLARSANVDEFMVMKYLVAIALLDGFIRNENIPALTNANVDDVITTVTTQTNLFQFPSTEWNFAHVSNTTPIEDLMIIETASASAKIKVNALAVAYNVDYVKFMGNVVMVDSFGSFDWDRMRMLFSEDPSFTPFTQDEIAALNKVELVAMDRKFLQIYDAKDEMGTPLINGEGLYENYFYHVWKVLGLSPFHNAIAYTSGQGSVTAVTISPGTASASPGQSVIFSASVATEGLEARGVEWSIETANVNVGTVLSPTGVLYISPEETVAEIVVKATSVSDPTKSATATITVVQ